MYKLEHAIFETLNTVKVLQDGIEVPLTNKLEKDQIVTLGFALYNSIPKNHLNLIQDFHKKFGVEKEETYDVREFKYSELRFRLILEEVFELAFALGLSEGLIYSIKNELFTKVRERHIEPSIQEVFDAIVDLQVVTEGTIDVFRLEAISSKGQEEVYRSNMSKLIDEKDPHYEETLKKSVTELNKTQPVVSKSLGGFTTIRNRDTGKILKPVTYKAPNLTELINNLIKK